MAPSGYAERGFVALPPPLPPERIAALREALEGWAGAAPPAGDAYGVLRHNLWRELPAFADALAEGSLAQLAAEILDLSEVVLFQDNLIWKPPGTAGRVQWHQDYAYWPLSAPRGVTLWLALDDADEGNGCLRYLAGTHREGERQPTNFITPGAASWRQDLPPLDWAAREGAAVAAPLRAGELLAHHPLTWHMSPENLSRTHRRAWSLTWIATDVRWDPGHAPHPFNYFLDPPPGGEVRGALFPRFARRGIGYPSSS